MRGVGERRGSAAPRDADLGGIVCPSTEGGTEPQVPSVLAAGLREVGRSHRYLTLPCLRTQPPCRTSRGTAPPSSTHSLRAAPALRQPRSASLSRGGALSDRAPHRADSTDLKVHGARPWSASLSRCGATFGSGAARIRSSSRRWDEPMDKHMGARSALPPSLTSDPSRRPRREPAVRFALTKRGGCRSGRRVTNKCSDMGLHTNRFKFGCFSSGSGFGTGTPSSGLINDETLIAHSPRWLNLGRPQAGFHSRKAFKMFSPARGAAVVLVGVVHRLHPVRKAMMGRDRDSCAVPQYDPDSALIGIVRVSRSGRKGGRGRDHGVTH